MKSMSSSSRKKSHKNKSSHSKGLQLTYDKIKFTTIVPKKDYSIFIPNNFADYYRYQLPRFPDAIYSSDGSNLVFRRATQMLTYYLPTVGRFLEDKVVLELGCGFSIPAIASLILGAKYAFVTDRDPILIDALPTLLTKNGIPSQKYTTAKVEWNNISDCDNLLSTIHSHKFENIDIILCCDVIYTETGAKDLFWTLMYFFQNYFNKRKLSSVKQHSSQLKKNKQTHLSSIPNFSSVPNPNPNHNTITATVTSTAVTTTTATTAVVSGIGADNSESNSSENSNSNAKSDGKHKRKNKRKRNSSINSEVMASSASLSSSSSSPKSKKKSKKSINNELHSGNDSPPPSKKRKISNSKKSKNKSIKSEEMNGDSMSPITHSNKAFLSKWNKQKKKSKKISDLMENQNRLELGWQLPQMSDEQHCNDTSDQPMTSIASSSSSSSSHKSELENNGLSLNNNTTHITSQMSLTDHCNRQEILATAPLVIVCHEERRAMIKQHSASSSASSSPSMIEEEYDSAWQLFNDSCTAFGLVVQPVKRDYRTGVYMIKYGL